MKSGFSFLVEPIQPVCRMLPARPMPISPNSSGAMVRRKPLSPSPSSFMPRFMSVFWMAKAAWVISRRTSASPLLNVALAR